MFKLSPGEALAVGAQLRRDRILDQDTSAQVHFSQLACADRRLKQMNRNR